MAHTTTNSRSLKSVGIKLVTPSTMGIDGSFEVQVVGNVGAGGAICAYQLERYTTVAGWTYLGQFAGPNPSYTDTALFSNGSYEYAMKVADCDNNWSGWTFSLAATPAPFDDNVFSYSGPWLRTNSNGAYGGSQVVGHKGAQATASLSFYNVGLVSATQSRGFGTFDVYVDGVLTAKNISTQGSKATAYRQVLFRQGSTTFGGHTVTVKVISGTVALDAVVVLGASPSIPTLTWTERFTPVSPSQRVLATMAYDSAHGQVILFGGASPGTVLADTWAWNGNTWTQLNPPVSPPARYAASMAYDSASGQVVLFGGNNGNGTTGFLNDTWAWDGKNWSQLSPASSPDPRYLATMAYDAAVGQAILFGGVVNNQFLNETWAWNGKTWTPLGPATMPSPRSAPSMAYDAAHEVLTLFDGSNELADTWTWDGTNWTQLFPVNHPSSRFYASMAYDTTHSQTILFSGASNRSPVPGDTWAWDGASWTQLSPTTSPPAHLQATMAYDSARRQIVLFGGSSNTGTTYFGDTWTLSGP